MTAPAEVTGCCWSALTFPAVEWWRTLCRAAPPAVPGSMVEVAPRGGVERRPAVGVDDLTTEAEAECEGHRRPWPVKVLNVQAGRHGARRVEGVTAGLDGHGRNISSSAGTADDQPGEIVRVLVVPFSLDDPADFDVVLSVPVGHERAQVLPQRDALAM